MPNISVIVPVYKVEPFIRRCVDSILSQTYEDFELILVDDGSPDNCGAICDEYAAMDGRVQVIHQKNGGLSAARNAGIDFVFANSRSQWLAFVDSDDWVHPDFLLLLHKAAEQTRSRISACGFFHTDGAPIPGDEDCSIKGLSADDYYCEDIHGNGTPAACGKLYHRSLFKSLRYPVGKLHEDEFTTYLALYEAGQIGVTPARLYGYFQNAQGITHSRWSPKRMHALEAFEKQIAFAQSSGNSRLLKKAVEVYIFSTYEQLGAGEKSFHRQLRQKLRYALKLGKECGFPAGFDQIPWAYEAAYPCKLLWWIVSRMKK